MSDTAVLIIPPPDTPPTLKTVSGETAEAAAAEEVATGPEPTSEEALQADR